MRDVATRTHEIAETFGHERRGTFSIQVNDKTFSMLIDQLYSRKQDAVVREIAANALDSHIAAGCPERPFLCQLPNSMEPFFMIRDFGTSLTDDQIFNLYTTVGMSTKEDTNTAVGKFGLGSKTPFAVTDSFTVTTYLDGTMRIYNAFKDSGIPQIALLVTEPTTEENGLAVSFPVPPSECAAFRNAALYAFLGFDVLPEIRGANLDFPPVASTGNGWKLYGRHHENVLNTLRVRQGCVIYPVTGSTDSVLNNLIQNLSPFNLIVDMPIGTVDITPSRESLSFDPNTVKNLMGRLSRIYEEILAPFIAPIETKTPYQAIVEFEKRMRDLESSTERNYVFHDAVKSRIKWRGKPVKGLKSKLNVDLRDPNDYRKPNPKFNGMQMHDILSHKYRSSRQGSSSPSVATDAISSRTEMHSISFDEVTEKKIPFILIRTGEWATTKRSKARVNHLLNKLRMDGRSFYKAILVTYSTERVLQKALVALGRPENLEVYRFSDLPLPPPVQRDPAAKKDYSDIAVKFYSQDGIGGCPVDLTDEEEDYLYVITSRGELTEDNNSPTGTAYSVASSLKAAIKLKLLPVGTKVYMLTKTMHTKVAKMENWQSLFDVLKPTDESLGVTRSAILNGRRDSFQRAMNIRLSGLFAGFLHPSLDLNFEGKKPAYNLLRVLLENGADESNHPDTQFIHCLASNHGIHPDLPVDYNLTLDAEANETINELMGQFRGAYPMVTSFLDACHGIPIGAMKNVSDYIKMIDKMIPA